MSNNSEENVYVEGGYLDRNDYLKSLSEIYSVPFGTVLELAELLGPIEDFDGLVTSLEDIL